MNEKNQLRFISIFTGIFLAIFAVSAVLMKNYGFMFYTIIASVLISIIVFYYKKFYLTPHVLFGLIIVGFLHTAGVFIYPWGTRLYDTYLISGILRYDNIVHSFGTFVITFIGYNLLKPHLNRKIKNNKALLSLILILIAMGIGAFNEIFELIQVIFLNGAERIGDYLNNALDLVFNLIGAIIASSFIVYQHKKETKT